MSKLFFVDFEASSLESGSFPIEIGWVGLDGQGESYLIQPQWNWTGWSAQAETVHRIPRAMLERDGQPAAFVARRAVSVLRGHQLISDHPEFEAYWMSMLLTIIDADPLSFAAFDDLIGGEISRLLVLNREPAKTPAFWRRQKQLLDEGEQLVAATALGMPAAHRALADAMGLWRHWKAVRAVINHRLNNNKQS